MLSQKRRNLIAQAVGKGNAGGKRPVAGAGAPRSPAATPFLTTFTSRRRLIIFVSRYREVREGLGGGQAKNCEILDIFGLR